MQKLGQKITNQKSVQSEFNYLCKRVQPFVLKEIEVSGSFFLLFVKAHSWPLSLPIFSVHYVPCSKWQSWVRDSSSSKVVDTKYVLYTPKLSCLPGKAMRKSPSWHFPSILPSILASAKGQLISKGHYWSILPKNKRKISAPVG